MKIKKILSYIFVLLLAGTLASCSDSGSGGDEGDPPSIPDLTAKAEPDVSFFQNNNVGGNVMQSSESYTSAQGTVLGGASFLGIGQVYVGFLNPASQSGASYNNGMWVWEYSGSEGGQSYSIRTTAKAEGDGFHWTTYLSYDDGQGNSVSDFKIMDGTTSNDGAQGDWTFYTLYDDSGSEPVPALTSSWNVMSDTESTINMKIYGDSSSDIVVSITYNENDPEYTMTFDYPGEPDANSIEVYWNTESKVGYYMSGSEQACWNSSFSDISCSDVGL